MKKMFTKLMTLSLFLAVAMVFAPVQQKVWAETAPAGSIDVTTLGVKNDGVTDDTTAIQNAISTAASQGKNLFFPQGTYVITGNITPASNVWFLGSTGGSTIFDASSTTSFPTFNQTNYYTVLNNVQFHNIIFANMGLNFYGGYITGIEVHDSAFINGSSPDPSSVNDVSNTNYYIKMSHNSIVVDSCVFLRGNSYPGGGIFTYQTSGSNVTNNYLGNLSVQQYANPMLNSTEQNILSQLNSISAKYNLGGNQGNFVRFMQADADSNLVFQNNFIYGNKGDYVTYADGKTSVRDHILYAHGYNGIQVIGNYFSGWAPDQYGGVKLRNSNNTVVASNFMDDTAFLSYIYNTDTIAPMTFTNAFYYNNFIRRTYNFNVPYGSAMYWQNFTNNPDNNQVGDTTNNAYYKNLLQTDAAHDDKFSFAQTDMSNFHFNGNIYTNTNTPIIVNGSSTYAQDNDSTIQALCPVTFSTIQNVPIPLYSTGGVPPR
ncbi:glycosyl hydrolase family 28-related protein [Paenibacillus filicis]|uniref:Glycosyl hydrolase family 28-related protein n=1 Tax=Paenibacillus gyeongsangnamensis TaxID=3388067 RepID=A0ABT4Q2A8_9BACL|nr:glycosyl hydrolase family 28-related protein [Paenibacillus filicis]MCZ8510961.1 glycosyl hydrolase family 28-related protein [Paenibacillus filicis]